MKCNNFESVITLLFEEDFSNIELPCLAVRGVQKLDVWLKVSGPV